jgi:hypothetical protein
METLPVYDIIPEALNDLVALAGGTTTGIAKILEEFQITATCGSASRCAVAQWLLATVRDADRLDDSITVHPGSVYGIVAWFEYEDDLQQTSCMAYLPPVVNEFAGLFDEHRFPELLDPVWPLAMIAH